MSIALRFPRYQTFGLLAAFSGLAPLALSAADDTAGIHVPVAHGKDDSALVQRTLHSWELPAIVVEGKQAGSFRDADLVGSYGQPRWSTRRLFSEVRTYVIPEGQAEFEYWLFVTTPSRNEKKAADQAGQPKPKNQIKQQYEVEFGLGHRLQLDLYQVYVKDGSDGQNALDATKFELRYALADWGRIWANPTLYAEWKQAADGADAIEGKLLLTDELGERAMWATNFVWEQETGGNVERGLEWNSAVGYCVIDEVLSVGVEAKLANVAAYVDRSVDDERESHWEVAAGPSIRYCPIPHAHVIISEFIGINDDAPESKTALIIGWEF